MTAPITNSYRSQILRANITILRQLGPSTIKPSQRDEIVRVLEDMIERLQADTTRGASN